MIEADDDPPAFLEGYEHTAVPPDRGAIIPFPRMRPNSKVAERWAAEAAQISAHKAFVSPMKATASVIRRRSLPRMAIPSAMPNLARRVVTYAGDMLGIIGSQGGGKTSIAIQIALANVAEGIPVLWAPLELDPGQVVTRIAGNLHHVHAAYVRDHWHEKQLTHVMASLEDMWMFVDRFAEPELQIGEIALMIDIAWRIYNVPPLVVVDHLGKLTIGREPRAATAWALEQLRAMTVAKQCFTLALSQGSRANQGKLTGRHEIESATDTLDTAAEARQFEEDCANVLAMSIFKVDTSLDETVGGELDGHALVGKARNTGLEGREGMRFHKAGGWWEELAYVPATPIEIKAQVEKAKRDKARLEPMSATTARAELNAERAGDAAALRRRFILEALTRHGAMGLDISQIRKIPGAGRGALTHQALQELERQGSIERTTPTHWRFIPRRL